MVFMMLQAISNEADRSRLTKFYMEYRTLLKRKALNAIKPFQMCNEYDLSDDLVQDAMARIIRNISTVRTLNEPQLVAYAVKTVQSCALDYCHRSITQQRAIESKEILEGSPKERIWEDDIPCCSEENPVIYLGRILDVLPQKDRDILMYKYFLNFDDSRIAELLEIQPNSVRMALTRARRKVKEAWNRMQQGEELF